ncbi:MAG: homocysteine S-methyltransferase family protein, partial [Verrucomicrobiota bacterium]
MKNILEQMKETPLVFDGAMGSVLYDRGIFINTCYDELNLTMPDLVKEIHSQYVQTDVDVIESNTFGANRIKLRNHGLADKVRDINLAGARLALETAGDDIYVAGSVGPCLRSGQMWQEDHREEIKAAFEEQMHALVEGGVHLLLLETFVHPEELKLAAEVARGTDVPVCALFHTTAFGETSLGGPIVAAAVELDQNENVDILGINCGVGPAHAYEAVESILPAVSKPLVVMPNAGMPKDIDGRLIYLSSPEYFTEYAKRFIELGAGGIGGCCGTTPE